MLTTSELSLARPSPKQKHVRFHLRCSRGCRAREKSGRTSAGDFDVGSRQTDGRHAHVQADVVVEHQALAGRGAVLEQRLLLDADRRLRALFVVVAAISLLSLLVSLVAATALRVTILVLRDTAARLSHPNAIKSRQLSLSLSHLVVFLVQLEHPGSGGRGRLGGGVLLSGQIERLRLRRLRSRCAGARGGGRLRQEARRGRHRGRHVAAHVAAQAVVDVPQVDPRHVQLGEGLVRRLTRRRIRSCNARRR